MILSPLDISADDLVALMAANSPNPRSTGLHQSDIIKSICRKLDPKRFGTGPMNMVKVEGGFCFEHAIEQAMAARWAQKLGLFRPGEVERDGISGSPDGLDITADPWVGYEFKQTEMSIGNGIRDPKFQHWIWQMKGYGYMLGVRVWILIADFLRGHYKFAPIVDEFGRTLPPGRLLLAWRFEFTDDELLMNWSMLLRHAHQEGMLIRET